MGCGASTALKLKEEYPSFYSKYVAGEELGRGSFGAVLVATPRDSTQTLAVKVQRGLDVGDANIKYEAELCLALQHHQNIVRLMTVCQEADIYFLVMERCLKTFRSRLVEALKWTVQELRSDFSQVLHGLAFLHSNFIVHRDIKAENILYGGEDGRTVKLADFGLARVLAYGVKLSSICGTTSYMAPEMLAKEGYAYGADMWSCGVLFFLTMCGEHPCCRGGESKEELKEAILDVRGEPQRVQNLALRVQSEYEAYEKRLRPPSSENFSSVLAGTQSVGFDPVKLAFMGIRREAVALVRGLLQRCPSARMSAHRALGASFLQPRGGDQLLNRLIVNRPAMQRKASKPVMEKPVVEQQEVVPQQRIAPVMIGKPPSSPVVTSGVKNSNSRSNFRSSENGSNFSSYVFGRSEGQRSQRFFPGSSINSVRSVVSDLPRDAAIVQLRAWHQELNQRQQEGGIGSDGSSLQAVAEEPAKAGNSPPEGPEGSVDSLEPGASSPEQVHLPPPPLPLAIEEDDYSDNGREQKASFSNLVCTN